MLLYITAREHVSLTVLTNKIQKPTNERKKRQKKEWNGREGEREKSEVKNVKKETVIVNDTHVHHLSHSWLNGSANHIV